MSSVSFLSNLHPQHGRVISTTTDEDGNHLLEIKVTVILLHLLSTLSINLKYRFLVVMIL
jgi:hypothetical protein